MWYRSSVVLALAFLFSATLSAQSSKPATPKKKTTASRAKGIVGKIVDSAATRAAAVATDTILGESAGAIAAVVAGGQPGAPPTCAAGMVLYPAPTAAPAAGASPGMPSAGASIVGAAKARFGKKAATPAAATAASPQFLCGTPEQATASMQAAPSGAQPSSMGVGSVLAATPQGMAVSGAIAAAPIAAAAAKKLGGKFRRGQTSETMKKDLSRGKLTIKGIKFVDAGDEMAPGFEQEITALAEALQAVEGQFVLSVAAESDGKSPPDALLAQRRMERVAAHLQIAGVPDSRLTVRGIQPAVLDPKGAPKPGDARVEIVRMPTQVKP